jgi:hypothetical protein
VAYCNDSKLKLPTPQPIYNDNLTYKSTSIHTRVLEIAKVMPAWLGATSAWLLRCPEELQALSPRHIVTNLK